ncbi:hypothetical protein AAC03nite_27450 [Alicyclobacillus acidoterrestris]|nr:hypothetical protein AAC03nite_27450 [Alicyclobacillus acidoterrestris]
MGNRTGAREVNKGTGTTCISPVAINIDADHPEEFANIAYGIRMAHRGWLKKTDVLNTLPYASLKKSIQSTSGTPPVSFTDTKSFNEPRAYS